MQESWKQSKDNHEETSHVFLERRLLAEDPLLVSLPRTVGYPIASGMKRATQEVYGRDLLQTEQAGRNLPRMVGPDLPYTLLMAIEKREKKKKSMLKEKKIEKEKKETKMDENRVKMTKTEPSATLELTYRARLNIRNVISTLAFTVLERFDTRAELTSSMGVAEDQIGKSWAGTSVYPDAVVDVDIERTTTTVALPRTIISGRGVYAPSGYAGKTASCAR
ncbi:hypothetical protein M9H77_07511 [Catharanthus roseus]|uniref:Uncharacterized protein n=1 Tax=Catharanthus roseus TaxID=4058 RepID=A0ACC0BV64_CATRO|nr:hypothetical protein M9H77_07511 [Catharanthus roseus]